MTVAIDTSTGPYPVEHLVGCETALILFAAAFLGINDAAWINDAGLRATCVDLDGERLDEMRAMYPGDWEFVCADAYDFPNTGGRWDVVSCDPFTNEFTRCADHIERWCALARRTVILGTGTDTVVYPPPGWVVTDRIRRTDYAGGVYWAVLERV